jgi:subtilisin family serine protease
VISLRGEWIGWTTRSQLTPMVGLELEAAIRTALSKRVILVASAGNDGELKNNYPARLDGVIGVSALNKNNMPATFTNIEPTNIFAPGQYLLTTGVNADNYTWFNGSSAATPLVASVCAIIKYYKPEWDSHKVKKVLLTYSEKKSIGNQEINILNVSNVLDYVLSTND